MDRKLHVDTLILIPMFKIYVLLYSRQMDKWTDRQTDRQMETLIRGGLGNYVPPGKEFLQPRCSKCMWDYGMRGGASVKKSHIFVCRNTKNPTIG
jgi:hypothetical protein